MAWNLINEPRCYQCPGPLQVSQLQPNISSSHQELAHGGICRRPWKHVGTQARQGQSAALFLTLLQALQKVDV